MSSTSTSAGDLDRIAGALDILFNSPLAQRESMAHDDAGDGVTASAELRAVTHRIASQFIDVIAAAASEILGSATWRAALEQLDSALDALERLATAARDDEHRALLAHLRTERASFEDRARSGRGHSRFRDILREWLPRYATFLGDGDGERLRGLVEFDTTDVPLFSHLQNIHGVGPRRLRRLYAAGLHRVDVLAAADPAEAAQVTGLPRTLTQRIVEATRAHREQRRSRILRDTPARLQEFEAIVEEVARMGNDELLEAARRATTQIAEIIASMRTFDDLD